MIFATQCHFLLFVRNFQQNRISQLREVDFADLPKLEYMWVKYWNFKSNLQLFFLFHITENLKARLHWRFLSRQLDAIFVALTLQLQNRTCKPDAIFIAMCRPDIAGVSNLFETCCNFSATKIASSWCDKNRLCKRAFTLQVNLVEDVWK